MNLKKLGKAIKMMTDIDVNMVSMSSEVVSIIDIKVMDLIKDESNFEEVSEKFSKVYNAMQSMSINKTIPFVTERIVDVNEFITYIQPNIEFINNIVSQDIGYQFKDGEGFSVKEINCDVGSYQISVFLDFNDDEGKFEDMLLNKIKITNIRSYFDNLDEEINLNAPIKNEFIIYYI